MVKSKTFAISVVMASVFLAGTAQALDFSAEKAILKYEISDLDGTEAGQPIPATSSQDKSTDQTEPASQPTGADILSLLLSKAGKKEKKIIDQILVIGQEKKLFNLEKLEKKLGSINLPAILNLYNNLKALKIKKLDLNKLDEIKETLASIDNALKQVKNSPTDFGNLSFFAGMTRDQLANHATTLAEKSSLRFSALENYNDTIKNLAPEKSVASQEKVEDAKERIAIIENPFGNVIPIAPEKGKGQTFITSDYGMRIHPVKKTRRFHAGVDLAGWKCKGWKVMSIGPGRVVKSSWETGYGYVVIVSHDVEGKQYFSRYAHLKKDGRLKNGTVVKQNEMVGYCNNSGISTGSHLHFEVREESFSGQTLDPKAYLPQITVLK